MPAIRRKAQNLLGNSLIRFGKKIVAVGKNYEKHALEMNNKSAPEIPIIFLKPTSSYIRNGEDIVLPKDIGQVHHELELGVVIGKKAHKIPQNQWSNHVGGYVLGLDMTARTLQTYAKENGLPWTHAKCYDTFTPISEFIHAKEIPHWDDVKMWLKIDGEIKQQGHTKDMVHSIPFLIEYISNIMTLEEGDVILTGTPEGVGPVSDGQKLTIGIDGIVEASFSVRNDNQ